MFIAPLRAGAPPEESAGIAVTDDATWHDCLHWSPDGQQIYVLSDRDGFRCTRALRLDAVTKRPAGAACAIQHLHQARRSMTNVTLGDIKMSVGHDRIVFVMGLNGTAGSHHPPRHPTLRLGTFSLGGSL